MITVDAFLTIEEALSALVRREALRLVSGVFSKAGDAARAGDFPEAVQIISGISLAGLFADDDEPLLYLTNVAMLFGASMVTQQPGTSVVGMGFEAQSAKQMVLSFLQVVRQKAEAHLQEKGLKLLQTLQAASIPTAVEGGLASPALKAEGRVLRSFESFMTSSGEAFFNIASSLHTSRASAFGFTAEAAAMGYEEYQLNEQLDSRTCPVCKLMHGKTFKVADARKLLNVVTRVSDPDDLKQLQPWPSQSQENLDLIKGMTPEELVSRGWHIPPFHPRCRGLLGKVGKVPSAEVLDSQPPTPQPKSYTAGPSDFKALGVKASKDMVAKWNANIPLPPAEVVARLSGKTTDQLLAALLGSKAPAKVAGIKKFTVGDALDLTLEAAGFGSSKAIKQQVVIDFAKKNLFLKDVALPAGVSDATFRAYMVEAYSVAKDAGLGSVSVEAGGAQGGFAYAKYGFRPTKEEWSSLRNSMLEVADEYALFTILPEAQAKALKALLAAEDPGFIFTLSDFPFGELLLKGTSWMGSLDLKDSESVTRFLTYVGGLK